MDAAKARLVRRALGALGLALCLAGCGGQSAATPTPASPSPSAVSRVGSLARLEPQGEILHLAVPRDLDRDRVSRWLVKEGDHVRSGQVLAWFDSRERLEQAVTRARARRESALARLRQVEAGAKRGEIQAQESNLRRLRAEMRGSAATQDSVIMRWEAEVRNAEQEYARYQTLFKKMAVAAQLLDAKRLVLDTARAQLVEARAQQGRQQTTLHAQIQEGEANLRRIREVRPVDVEVAASEVRSAESEIEGARVDAARAYLRAPREGQILKIYTRAGEQPSAQGLADLGQTDRMEAVAEVYETDISPLRLGQSATVKCQAISEPLHGRVSRVGLQVVRQSITSNEPGANFDRRVVEVRITLDPRSSRLVRGYTNMQVEVLIDTANPGTP